MTSGAFYEFMTNSPLNADGPKHRAWRKRMVRTFTPRNVDQLRPYLRQESHRLVVEFARSRSARVRIIAWARRWRGLSYRKPWWC